MESWGALLVDSLRFCVLVRLGGEWSVESGELSGADARFSTLLSFGWVMWRVES